MRSSSLLFVLYLLSLGIRTGLPSRPCKHKKQPFCFRITEVTQKVPPTVGRIIPRNVTPASNATMPKNLLLPSIAEDPCLQLSTRTARQECLQHLLETYYGDMFTDTCPGLSHILARVECKECPWDRIDPDVLANMSRVEFPLQPKSKFFHDAGQGCRIAEPCSGIQKSGRQY